MADFEKQKPKKTEIKSESGTFKDERLTNADILALSLIKQTQNSEEAFKIFGRIDFQEPEKALQTDKIIDTVAFLNFQNVNEAQMFKYRNDPQLQKLVIQHKGLILEPGSNEKLRQNSRTSLKEYLRSKLSLEFPDQKSFNLPIALFEGHMRRTTVLQRAINDIKSDSPEKVTEFAIKFRDLYKQCEKGEITQSQCLQKYDALVQETVEESGDEKLKQTWQTYQKEEKAHFEAVTLANENTPSPSEKPVESESESKNILTKEDIAITGGELQMQSSNMATVHFQEGLTIGLSIYKDQNTDQYIFYLEDEFLREPIRVKAQDLKQTLDQRRIDAFMSQKLAPFDSDNDPVAEISETKLTSLIYVLLGTAEERNFQFKETDYLIMANLAKVLGEKDDKYLGFEQKLQTISDFVGNTTEKASLIVGKLRIIPSNQIYSASKLIS